ncbi:hypothetical protein [Herbiconiux sp.]|uniref:hypothetical protein n=1 Tax=Herbiconiux sp. TaxID=1871186 RepID=UPI0025C601DB|nr:hypothetical protein [Herbiconiux sp.]
MATGDVAAAQGLPVLDGTEDRREGYDEINLTRDLIAGRTAPTDDRSSAPGRRSGPT